MRQRNAEHSYIRWIIWMGHRFEAYYVSLRSDNWKLPFHFLLSLTNQAWTISDHRWLLPNHLQYIAFDIAHFLFYFTTFVHFRRQSCWVDMCILEKINSFFHLFFWSTAAYIIVKLTCPAYEKTRARDLTSYNYLKVQNHSHYFWVMDR